MDTETAWAIGLFEGEGCINAHVNRSRGYAYKRVALQLATTDEDVAQRFQKIVGKGTVRGPYQRANHKPYWLWKITAAADVRAVLNAWMPMLGQRRRAVAKAALLHIERR